MKASPKRYAQSTMSHKMSTSTYRPQTQEHRRNVSSVQEWTGRKTTFKFRSRQGK